MLFLGCLAISFISFLISTLLFALCADASPFDTERKAKISEIMLIGGIVLFIISLISVIVAIVMKLVFHVAG